MAERSKDRQFKQGDMIHKGSTNTHSERRSENTSGFEGFDSANAETGHVGMVPMNVHDPNAVNNYEAAKVTDKKRAMAKSDAYNDKHGKGSKERGTPTPSHDSAKDTIPTDVKGILGNTTNVPREPVKGGQKISGFGGGGEGAKSGKHGHRLTGSQQEHDVVPTNVGGTLGNTPNVPREPTEKVGKSKGMAGFSGGAIDGYVR